MRKILPKQQRDVRDKKICKIYQRGKSVKQIADELKVSGETVYRVLDKYEVRKKRMLPEPGMIGVKMAKNLNTAKPFIVQGRNYMDLTDCIAGR